jgi:hypothetical protein
MPRQHRPVSENRGFITGLPVQRCVEPLGDKRFPGIEDGLRVTVDERSNLRVGFLSMGQDVGMPIGTPLGDILCTKKDLFDQIYIL